MAHTSRRPTGDSRCQTSHNSLIDGERQVGMFVFTLYSLSASMITQSRHTSFTTRKATDSQHAQDGLTD